MREPVLHPAKLATIPTVLYLTANELAHAVAYAPRWTPAEPAVVVVPLNDAWPPLDPRLALAAAVIVGVGQGDQQEPGTAWCDVTLTPADPALGVIVEQVSSAPIAAVSFVQVLRGAESRSIGDGLVLESAVYSALQAGPEFRRWRQNRPRKQRPEPHEDPVLLDRDGNRVTITLNRPHVRNALNTAMRDALVDAFRMVSIDESIDIVTLCGAGSDYSSGGDLDEFGSFPSPASAHVMRLTASVGSAIAAVSARVRVELHGACLGSGIELPAFAAKVIADRSSRISLPELQLGLIPGAGGTWSLPQRIGRHRTALLGLTCTEISSVTALEWGLVDELG